MKHLTKPGKNGRSRSVAERPAAIRVTCRFGAPPDRVDETEARWTGVLYGLDETLSALPRD